MFIQGMKSLSAGVSTVSIIGSGIGIGLVFGCLILGVAQNPDAGKQLFGYAILGFALTESIALLGLMMAFLLLYSNS